MRGFVTLHADSAEGQLLNDVSDGPITFSVDRFAYIEHGADGSATVTLDRPEKTFCATEKPARVVTLVAAAKT